MFLEQHGEFKEVEFTPFASEKKFVEKRFIFLHAAAAFLQHRADQLEQEKFKHACCMFA